MDVDPIASLTVHQLRVFSVMADALSLSQAARELDLAPSTVSEHIAQLERSIGTRLFDRSRGRRGLRLTDAGELLAETAREALRTLEVGARRALDQTGSKRAVVNLGCGIRFSERLLPALVKRLREDAQDLDVRVLVAGEYILHQQLLRGRLDLCIWRGPIEEPRIGLKPLGIRRDLVLVAPPNHRLAGKHNVPMAALENEQFILPKRPASSRVLLERKAEELGVRLDITLELSHPGARFAAAAGGLGIADADRSSAELAQERGKIAILDVAGFPLDLEWAILWYHGRFLASTERALSELTDYFAGVPTEAIW
jgi:LysR family transcriptional regulator, low CO2-responsive transcriptional regulator